MDTLLELDRKLFLFLNGLHASWLDTPMALISGRWFWLPLYAILLWVIIRDYRKQSWVVLVAIGLTLALCDQITSHLMKEYFQRLRPTHDPALSGLVHTVNGYQGGLYGFASGHAANTFGVATLVVLLLGIHYPWMRWLFLWAAIVSYSRIYLGVHYPGDVVAGAAVGVVTAWVIFRAMRHYTVRYFAQQHIFTDRK